MRIEKKKKQQEILFSERRECNMKAGEKTLHNES